jgi:hypothetical protein
MRTTFFPCDPATASGDFSPAAEVTSSNTRNASNPENSFRYAFKHSVLVVCRFDGREGCFKVSKPCSRVAAGMVREYVDHSSRGSVQLSRELARADVFLYLFDDEICVCAAFVMIMMWTDSSNHCTEIFAASAVKSYRTRR